MKKSQPNPPRRPFRNCERGAIAVEFALMVPFFLFLSLGGYEISRYIMISQRAERSTYALADIVAQQTFVTSAQLDQTILASNEIMQPYEMGPNSRVIISSVYKSGANAPKVQWQHVGGGSMAAASRIGAISQDAALPGNLRLKDKDNIIVAEFYYEMDPLLGGVGIKSQRIYKTAVYKPRLGQLVSPTT